MADSAGDGRVACPCGAPAKLWSGRLGKALCEACLEASLHNPAMFTGREQPEPPNGTTGNLFE